LPACGDANSALMVIEEGLASYPDERRLLSRKEALLKIVSSVRRSERREEKEKDLDELNGLLKRMEQAQDAAAVDSIRERSIAIARKHHGDPEFESVFRSVGDLWDAVHPSNIAPKASIPKFEPLPESGRGSETPKPPPEASTNRAERQHISEKVRNLAVIFRQNGERGLATLRSIPRKRIAIFVAIPLSAIVLVASIVTYKKVHPPPPPKREAVIAKVEINTSAPGARVFVDGKEIGPAPQALGLSEGEHQIDAELTGYGSKGPVVFRVERGAPPPPSTVTVALEPLPTIFRISTEFQQASLDNEKLM